MAEIVIKNYYDRRDIAYSLGFIYTDCYFSFKDRYCDLARKDFFGKSGSYLGIGYVLIAFKDIMEHYEL